MFRALIEQGNALAENPMTNVAKFPMWVNKNKQGEFLKWEMTALLLLQETYKGHSMVDDFKKAVDEDKKQCFIATLITQVGILEAFEKIQTKAININYDTVVCGILDRFNACAQQLKRRHEGRETIVITDEYDVQDLLHALLRLHFSDVRPEEWIPSYAGNSNRMDFLLKEAKVAIEVKMTRKGLSDKEIGNQLLIDIAKYKEHPDVKTLYCFIYDPGGFVRNPVGLENDLNKQSTDAFTVKVLVRPS